MKKQSKTQRRRQYKDGDYLVLNEEFQREVRRLRKRWGIPETGFKNSQECIKWSLRLAEKDTGGGKVDYTEVNSTLDRRGREIINLFTSFTQKVKPFGFSLFSQFRGEIGDLCWLLNLPSSWSDFVRRYTLRNHKIYSALRRPPHPSRVVRKLGNHTPRDSLRLEFGVDTTLEDIASVWEKVERLQEKMRGFEQAKRRWKENTSRDLKWYKKHYMEGKTPSEIWREEEFPHGSEVQPAAVAKTLKRVNKRVKTKKRH